MFPGCPSTPHRTVTNMSPGRAPKRTLLARAMRLLPPPRPSAPAGAARPQSSATFRARAVRSPAFSWPHIFRLHRVDITPDQHFPKPELLRWFKATLRIPHSRIAKRAEQHVPHRQVGVVEGMNAFLVVNAVAFGALKHEPQPVRRANVPVIDEFRKPAEQHASRGGGRSQSDDEIQDCARQSAVRQNFKRMFIKTCDYFDTPRAVMYLVKPPP